MILGIDGIDLKNYSVLCTVAERLGLRDLQEAAEAKMASMYKDVCETKEFLTHINADQLLSLLGRDDFNSSSEAFVFKSAMKWIRHKRGEDGSRRKSYQSCSSRTGGREDCD